MNGYVIVPGLDGSDAVHWQSHWEQDLDGSVVRIDPASWTRPDLADWTSAIERAVATLHPDVDRVILIAHSLGCWASAAWTTATNRPPHGVLLVAPPDPAATGFPAERAPTFAGMQAHPLPTLSMVVASTDDLYCTMPVAEQLAADWHSELRVIDGGGHLNSASGLGGWPEGRRLLDEWRPAE